MALALLCWVAACSRPSPTRSLQVQRTTPAIGAGTAPLLLNESLTVYFDDSVDPLSLTSDSVAVVDEHGQQIPGTLRSGANWVSFVPIPPLAASLDDGSFRPGSSYRLLLAGGLRPDAIRSRAGCRLSESRAFDIRVAARELRPDGLPAPLRPLAEDMPFFLRGAEGLQQVAADDPRLHLHFSAPVLPTQLSPASFEVVLLDNPLATLVPRAVRLLASRMDVLPGCTVEIDLGGAPQRADGSQPRPLHAGDWLSVALRPGANAVLDLAGNRPVSATPQWWTVVAGDTVAVGAWPQPQEQSLVDDGGWPGFEVRDGIVRPRVRRECGSGRLGVFRPSHDVVLRPGQAFDRGDGTLGISEGSDFPFLVIDVPPGVRVMVDATAGPVHLLSCGDVRIAGTLEIHGDAAPLPPRRTAQLPIQELIGRAPVAVVAGGEFRVRGEIRAAAIPAEDRTPLLLASVGDMDLQGELPFRSLLAVEGSEPGRAQTRIRGARGQTLVFAAEYQPGLADGAEFEVRGMTSWLPLPADRDSVALALVAASGEVAVAWQAVAPDPLHKDRPDLSGRPGRLEPVRHGEMIAAGAGSFVRLALRARVRAGQPLPTLREARLLAR